MQFPQPRCLSMRNGRAWRGRTAAHPELVCLRKSGIDRPKHDRPERAAVAEEEQVLDREKRRIMFLVGRWAMPGSRYDFTATLYLSAGGAAEGPIHWHAQTVWYKPQVYSATEQVRGQVADTSAELHGYRSDPLLAPDHYKLQLSGDARSGTFRGISRTCLGDWSGRAWGSYMLLDRWEA
jgi:hypothetical protein